MQHRKVMVSAALAVTLLFPQATLAGVEDLKQQQGAKQQELEQAKQREKDAQAKKAQFQQEINVNANEINKLAEQIDTKESEISKLQASIFTKTQQIEQTTKDLAAAEERVQARDKLLKERLRLMYQQGDVQYMEVLLDSTSFSDFLDRFDSLQAIFKQDKQILRKNKEDRDLIASTKQRLEGEKNDLTKMKASQEEQKSQLDQLKNQKEAINRQLEANKSEQERIEQEAQKIQDAAISEIYRLSQQIEAERYKENTAKPSQTFTGPFTWPLPGVYTITDEFGDRIDPFTGQRMGHNGMDIGAAQGTTVVAAQSGTVITAGWVSGFGNCIIINHGNGLWSLYGHLMNGGILVSVGQEVRQGDVIGKVGSTGRSTGPHLHFGVYENGSVVNPRKYL